MKKSFVITLLGLFLFATGCGEKKTSTEEVEEIEVVDEVEEVVVEDEPEFDGGGANGEAPREEEIKK